MLQDLVEQSSAALRLSEMQECGRENMAVEVRFFLLQLQISLIGNVGTGYKVQLEVPIRLTYVPSKMALFTLFTYGPSSPLY